MVFVENLKDMTTEELSIMVAESAIREHIDDWLEEELSYIPNLSMNFIREFADRIDFRKMLDMLLNDTIGTPIYSKEWYKEQEKLKKIEKEFLKGIR